MFATKIGTQSLDQLAARFRAAGANAPKEVGRVIVDVERATRTEARRAVAKRANLKAKRIADDLFSFNEGVKLGTRLGGRIGGTGLGFAIVGRRQPISFGSYGARAGRKGVRVRIFRGQVEVIRSGFAGRGPAATSNSKRDVRRRAEYAQQIGRAYDRPVNETNLLFWQRTGDAPRRMEKGRNVGLKKEPIRPLFGPSIADHLANDSVRAQVNRFAVQKFNQTAARRISLLLSRRRSP